MLSTGVQRVGKARALLDRVEEQRPPRRRRRRPAPLQHLPTPQTDVDKIMRRVGAAVEAETNKRQKPYVNSAIRVEDAFLSYGQSAVLKNEKVLVARVARSAIQLGASTQLPGAPAASAASSSAASALPVELAGAAETRPATATDAIASVGARLRGAARRLCGSRELLVVLAVVPPAVMLRPRRSIRALGAS